LIITFVVDEGIPTRIADVSVKGNTAIPESVLLAKLPDLKGKNFSRARARNGVRRLKRVLLAGRFLRRKGKLFARRAAGR
jgi:outer membrane protein assembly factor BamA